MKVIKRSLFIMLILMITLVISGAVELSIAQKAIPEPAQMFLLGICLLGLAGYGRRRIYKK
jgi:hypothetical protein